MEGYISIEKYEQVKAKLAAFQKQWTQEIELLKFQLTELKRLVFGTKSERYIPAQPAQQLSMFEVAPT